MNTSYWPVRSGLGIALACATCLLSIEANATSCAINWVRAPADGATDVPTNTRLWGFYGGDTLLVGPNGPVPLEVRYVRIAVDTTQATRLSTLVPTRELEPNTSYTIEAGGSGRRGFVTGAGPAQQPPQLPDLLSNEARAGDAEFGSYRYRELEFSHGPIIVGDANLALGLLTSIAELEVTEDDREPAPLEPASPILRWATSDTRLDVGLGACLVWPDADAGQALARFGAFDLAGNFSGWLEPLTLAIPTEAEAVLLIERQRAEREAEHQARLLEIYGDELNDDDPALLSQCGMTVPSRDRVGSLDIGAWLALGVVLARRRGQRAASTANRS